MRSIVIFCSKFKLQTWKTFGTEGVLKNPILTPEDESDQEKVESEEIERSQERSKE